MMFGPGFTEMCNKCIVCSPHVYLESCTLPGATLFKERWPTYNRGAFNRKKKKKKRCPIVECALVLKL